MVSAIYIIFDEQQKEYRGFEMYERTKGGYHVLPNTYEFKLTTFRSTKLKKRPGRILLSSITLSDKKVSVVKRNLKSAINEDRLSMFSAIKNGNMFYPYWVYNEFWDRVL